MGKGLSGAIYENLMFFTTIFYFLFIHISNLLQPFYISLLLPLTLSPFLVSLAKAKIGKSRLTRRDAEKGLFYLLMGAFFVFYAMYFAQETVIVMAATPPPPVKCEFGGVKFDVGDTREVDCGSGTCAGKATVTCQSGGTWSAPGDCSTKGTVCNDENTCTSGEKCTSAGACSGGTPLSDIACITLDGKSGKCFSGVCQATCTGSVVLTLTPAEVNKGDLVTPAASGLSNCSGKLVFFKQTSCQGTNVASCAIGADGDGCTGAAFVSPGQTGQYTYAACIDKNGDGDFDD